MQGLLVPSEYLLVCLLKTVLCLLCAGHSNYCNMLILNYCVISFAKTTVNDVSVPNSGL